MDLKVQMFSTARVQGLELRSDHAGMRLCARCAEQVLSSPVQVNVADGKGVSANGHVAARVFLDGEVKAATSDGRAAEVAGRWLVTAEHGELRVSVEVPSERYVMGVLQAEASSEEPMESLKALAVVARSFAMQNLRRHGAEDICDSTHCQALRFGVVPERVRAAVEATAGETLWIGRGALAQQVAGYFTQNCGGMTEDASAMWGGEVRRPWLAAHADPYCVRRPALWHAQLRLEQVRTALVAEGIAVPAVVSGLRVVKTDASGRAAELEVRGGPDPSGAQAHASLQGKMDGLKPVPFKAAKSTRMKAATLRFALNRAFGWNELRSDWYRVSMVSGSAVFDGRGYGHGVGLCQAGARDMAVWGKGYREILGFYFPGTNVRVFASDEGWAWRQGNGWTLHATEAGNEWIAAGDAAWRRAREVFPATRTVRPVVTVYPTTELFREATGEPGWELGVTRGTVVAVQTADVVRRGSVKPTHAGMKPRHGGCTRDLSGLEGMEELLRHEFLHVLVEQQAGAAAPLWLREGLVEVLAGGAGKSAGSAGEDKRVPGSRKSLDERLAGAATQAESQGAHAEADVRVAALVQRYGVAAVRGWLRSGIPAGVLTSE